jgi:hypothetical protein
MSRVPVFVELCAGTAALSLRLARSKARPPVSRMGAKTGYADAILARMGLQAGQGADGYFCCEPDSGVRLLLHAYTDRRLARAAADVIRGWAEEEPRALWERLKAEGPVRAPEPREVARWAYLHQGSFQYRGVTAGIGRPQGVPACGTYGAVAPLTEMLPRLWSRLPQLPGCIVPDATEVEPARLPAGSWVYIDPPYVGTTKYAHDDLPRAEVVRLARLWRDAGAHVAISEAEPIAELVADGWHAHELTAERVGQKRTFSKQQREWLTMTRAPRGQLGLWGS